MAGPIKGRGQSSSAVGEEPHEVGDQAGEPEGDRRVLGRDRKSGERPDDEIVAPLVPLAEKKQAPQGECCQGCDGDIDCGEMRFPGMREIDCQQKGPQQSHRPAEGVFSEHVGQKNPGDADGRCRQPRQLIDRHHLMALDELHEWLAVECADELTQRLGDEHDQTECIDVEGWIDKEVRVEDAAEGEIRLVYEISLVGTEFPGKPKSIDQKRRTAARMSAPPMSARLGVKRLYSSPLTPGRSSIAVMRLPRSVHRTNSYT